MVLNRKFTIWLISFAVVLIAFLLYRSASDVGVIEVTTLDSQIGKMDVNQITADANAGQIGKTKVEYVEKARFETVDAKTRKLKRVVGFEKVLHKTGNEWLLDKPYMNVFQGKMRADITSDTGTIELENVQGSSPTPKMAVLQGNVVIHILPDMTTTKSESYVYLKQVTFDSDRSMFYSNDDVNFVSADAHLMGKGLEVVYNSITNKLEYLKVKKVDYLYVKGISQISRAQETKPKDTNSDNVSAAAVKPVETKPVEVKTAETKPVETKPVEIKTAETNSVGIKSAVAKAEDKKESFQCLFRDNARLEHRNEVVLADEIAITDIVQKEEKESNEPVQIVTPAVEPNAGSQKIAQKTQNASENKNVQKPTMSATEPNDEKNIMPQINQPGPQVNPQNEQQIVATVKCDGPMIIRPDSAAESDDYILRPFKKFSDLTQSVLNWLGRRNVLIAQRVTYDYNNAVAQAHGQVELVFYPESKKTAQKDSPFTIDAQKGAEFITAQNKAIFSGNVRGSFTKFADSYDEENKFFGDKLFVDLVSEKSKTGAVETSNISHITVTGPGVRLESIRTSDLTVLSHVRLKSKRIDYDKASEQVIATGKGVIEYKNTETQENQQIPSNSAFNKPCFALVQGFDKLVWDTNSLQVNAYSDKTRGVHVGYLPVEENGYGNRITVDTRQVRISYYEPVKGKAQLKHLYANGGVVYYEQPKFEFVGRELNYNAIDEFLTVSGDKDMPCMFNGAMTDGIEYNLKTGSANAVITGGIGIMPAPSKK